MKCTKCGADCDPRQLFCLRCGTPLNGSKNDESIMDINEVEVPIENIVKPISLEDEEDEDDIDLLIGRDFSRNNRQDNFQSNDVKKTSIDLSGISENDTTARTTQNRNPQNRNTQNRTAQSRTTQNNNDKEVNKDSDKKKVIMWSCIGGGALILLVAIIVFIFVILGGQKDYAEVYDEGLKLYQAGKVEESIDQFIEAENLAETDKDKIEVKVMLWKVYSQIDGYENEQIKILSNLIKLEPENEMYYQALITIYQVKGDKEAIENLISSITDKELKEKLENFDGTTPVPTVPEGRYEEAVSIGLTAAKGNAIYYTINGKDPSKKSTVYTSSIELNEEGTYVLKAVAIDKKGNVSKIYKGTYELDFGSVNAPVVSLDSGTYNELKKIKVTADKDTKIYYTTDESVPDESSKLYTKAIKMKKDTTVYSFVAINEKGTASDVVTRVYSFKPEFVYDYNTAVNSVISSLVSDGIIDDSDGIYEDGTMMNYEYLTVQEIDDEYYYIIKASNGDDYSEIYAYGCNTGKLSVANATSEGYSLNDGN